jgi:hypothetical protein
MNIAKELNDVIQKVLGGTRTPELLQSITDINIKVAELEGKVKGMHDGLLYASTDKAPAEKTERPHVVDVYHCVYRDVDRREFTQYTIKFSDGSGCYFRKPKMEICNETL